MAIPGWTSVTSVTAFFGAINSLGIAILGEYIARIYDQVRGRPNFVVARSCNGKQIGRLDSDTTTSTEESKVLQQVESIRKIIRKDNTDSKKTTPTVDSLER